MLPSPTGLAVAVDDPAAARRFYADLCQPDQIVDGEFAGIPYTTLLRDGQPVVIIFQRGAGHPLSGLVPILTVASVAACEEHVRELGGSVLIAPRPCPITGALVAACCDHAGHQFLIVEAPAPI